MNSPKLGFDRASARVVDENGFLHVSGCNISKATVNPYLGAEIPGWGKLGLDPAKIYRIFRPPTELEAAAPTCNMIPLMDTHIEVSAFDLENPDIACHRVGSTGQVGRFEDPYLINDLVITNAGAIEGINSKEQCELSCAYRYAIVMKNGTYQGMTYDGYMTNIRFNHVALVEEGRAGPDVMVRDNNSIKEARMAAMKTIRDAMQAGPLKAIATACATHDIEQREDVNPKAGTKQYGNVKFADPVNKKYPLDTPEHVRAAASYFGMAKNRAKYSPEDAKVIQGRISAAEAKMKIKAAVGDGGFPGHPFRGNQHMNGTSASLAAHNATKAASGKAVHLAAAAAHVNASKVAARGGRVKAAEYHAAQAAYHTRRANRFK